MSKPEPCPICKVSDGPCRNTIQPDEPLPGREFHYARVTDDEADDHIPARQVRG